MMVPASQLLSLSLPLQIAIIDFDDSFTYNIAAEMQLLGVKVQVISWTHLPQLLPQVTYGDGIIWGPGPGHPSAYHRIFSTITLLRERKNLFHLGICLGHQILGVLDGHICRPSQRPLHGQSISLTIPPWRHLYPSWSIGQKVQVQRYNSLAIVPAQRPRSDLCHLVEGEIMVRTFSRGLSYQFHPESVGTSCPSLFFGAFCQGIYNDSYGKRETSPRGNIRQ